LESWDGQFLIFSAKFTRISHGLGGKWKFLQGKNDGKEGDGFEMLVGKLNEPFLHSFR
jgi:hypothetical protein